MNVQILLKELDKTAKRVNQQFFIWSHASQNGDSERGDGMEVLCFKCDSQQLGQHRDKLAAVLRIHENILTFILVCS